MRQMDLIDITKLSKCCITIIGAGSIGSFTALTLAKMGVGTIKIFDGDGVTTTNLSSQFFRNKDVGKFKVDAIKEIIEEFSECKVIPINQFYKNRALSEYVIVATDSMESRRVIWEQFNKQPKAQYLIEARMGAELAKVYTIKNKYNDFNFYIETLHSDAQAYKLPCTARTIIYNVQMISSLIVRAFKSIVQNETNFPKEIVFSTRNLNAASLMLRD